MFSFALNSLLWKIFLHTDIKFFIGVCANAAATGEFTAGLSIYSINALAVTFHFFEGGAFVSSKGAPVPWHNVTMASPRLLRIRPDSALVGK